MWRIPANPGARRPGAVAQVPVVRPDVGPDASERTSVLNCQIFGGIIDLLYRGCLHLDSTRGATETGQGWVWVSPTRSGGLWEKSEWLWSKARLTLC